MKGLIAKTAFVSSLLLVGGLAASGADMFTDGGFVTGCNYWASHAGIHMWRDWNGDQIEKDLAVLKKSGIDVMRVFPLWPDFQPLTAILAHNGNFRGMQQADGPMQNEAGVDEEMMRRFRFLCDAAAKNDIKLVVGLVTGWMSGRLFVPLALERKSIIADHESVMWQVRYVRHFVREMKDHPAIAAWDLGNECNVMSFVESQPAVAWTWMNAITGAIRVEDASRPVVSGMHSCPTQVDRAWNLRHQGELVDVLTTHPYPLFTPQCAREDFDTMRNACHPTAESLMYAGLSGKPCFIEEAGDLGPCTASPERAAATLRAGLFTAWANGLHGYLWWCAFDQDRLRFPPYTTNVIECELGLLTADFELKPQAVQMRAFREFVRTLPCGRLPPRRVDAVCLLSEHENAWSPALGAFLLSRQAGFDIAFAGVEQKEWPDAKLYILPSGTWMDTCSVYAWEHVLKKAEEGATVMISKGYETRYPRLLKATGTQVETFNRSPSKFTFSFADGTEIRGADSTTTRISAVDSTVLAKTPAGDPVVTVAPRGKGKVIFVNFAIEVNSVESNDCFTGPELNPRHLVYRAAAREAGIVRKVTCELPGVGLTEHPLADGRTVVVAVNYEPSPAKVGFAVSGEVVETWRGKVSKEGFAEISANDAVVFVVE